MYKTYKICMIHLNDFIEAWNKNDNTMIFINGENILFTFFIADENYFKIHLDTYINGIYEIIYANGNWSKAYKILTSNVDDNNKNSLTIDGDLTVAGNISGIASSTNFILNNNANLGYRQPNTAYAVGAIAYHSVLPTGWHLECTTAGTTGSSNLTITNIRANTTVSDGTVTWTITSLSPTLHLVSPNGAIANDLNNCKKMGVYKYKSQGDSPTLNTPTYYGICATFPKQIGLDDCFQMSLATDSNIYTRSFVDSSWNNWKQQEAIVKKSLAVKGYITYASGLILQWGFVNTGNVYEYNGSFPIVFPTNKLAMSAMANNSAALRLESFSNSGFHLMCTNYIDHLFWFAIGY